MHTHILESHQRFSNTQRWAVALIAVVTLTLGAVFAAHAATLDCSGGPTTRALDLWAKQGTTTLADSTVVNIYGYAANSGDAAGLPGPTLKACTGDTVNVTLHNVDLPTASSLAVHGQSGLPADRVGVAAGSSKTYSFTAHAGTFVYQAGLTADGPVQAAMGLYGALVVYQSGGGLDSGQAYGTTATAFGAESLVLLSEIDPALNANPAGFDMHDYAPKYWLINGKSYPDTVPIQATAGITVLLRYANAGFEEHSMGMLGLDQTVIASNGYLLPYSYGVVAETVPPGGSLDTLMVMPASGSYPLYDANQHIDNNGVASSTGGMFTLVSPGAPTGIGAPEAKPITNEVAPKPVDVAPPSAEPVTPVEKAPADTIIVPPAQ